MENTTQVLDCACAAPDKEQVEHIIDEIKKLFSAEGSAVDYSSDKSMYEYLKNHQEDFYVSDVHVCDEDLGQTFYVVAEDKEAYDKYEECIEHQHHPNE